MTKRKKKLKIETSIISVCLHSCNPIVASEKTPKKLKTQSSLFSPFPEHKQSQRDIVDRVERQVENIIFPFQNTCNPPLLLKDKRKLGLAAHHSHPLFFFQDILSISWILKEFVFQNPKPQPTQAKVL
ncbi:unnamed protein product, partial [Sphagnum troendelagicum]